MRQLQAGFAASDPDFELTRHGRRGVVLAALCHTSTAGPIIGSRGFSIISDRTRVLLPTKRRRGSVESRKGKPSSSVVPAASGAATSSRRKCRRPEGRDRRGLKTMEETMRIFTVSELSCYSSVTLRTLETRMRSIADALPEDQPDRRLALTNLWTIRRVLALRREPTLG